MKKIIKSKTNKKEEFKIKITNSDIQNHKQILKSRRTLLKKMDKGKAEIWKKNELNEFFDEKHSNLKTIILQKMRYNRFWFYTRNFATVIMVFFGIASIAASSYFIGTNFYQSSFINSFNENFSKTSTIILNIGARPGTSKAPDAKTYMSNVQQNINLLFTQKVIDNKTWNIRDLSLKDISSTQISVSGPEKLIKILDSSDVKKLWTTDQSKTIAITDLLGDDIYIGAVKGTPQTEIWIHNLIRWLNVWYGASIDETSENQMISDIEDISRADAGSFLGQKLTSDIFSDVFNQTFEDSKTQYSLNFQISGSAEWSAMSKYIYDVMKVILYDVKDPKTPEQKLFHSENDADKKNGNNRFLHTFLLFWYGDAPQIVADHQLNTLITNPTKNNTVSYFDYNANPFDQKYGNGGIFDAKIDVTNPVSSGYIQGMTKSINGDSHGDNPFYTDSPRKNSYPISDKYRMATSDPKDNATDWNTGRLIGIYTIDYSDNFKNGVSASSLDFKNGDSQIEYNNFSYFIAAGTDDKWANKDNSKNATNNLSNLLRNSLGQYYTKIISIIYNEPLLFSNTVLIFVIIGVVIVLICFMGYLLRKYKWLGLISVFALFAFIFAVFTGFVIFQTNFIPSMIVVVLIGLALMMINIWLFLKDFTKPFAVPEEKTFFEAYLVRSRKLFLKLLGINLPIFMTLYLAFSLVLTVLQGSNILWISYIFSILIIIYFYIVLFCAFLLQNNKKLRNDPSKIKIYPVVEHKKQLDDLHFYTVKSEEEHIDERKVNSIYYKDDDEEQKLIDEETKKINYESKYQKLLHENEDKEEDK